MNDELLLAEIVNTLEAWQDEGKDYIVSFSYKSLAFELLAKLKAMGYEQVWVKCPDCGGTKRIFRLPVTALGETSNEFPCPTCKGTGRKRKLVKWDREKVATHFALCKGRLSTEEQQHRFADQLKEILAEGEL